MHSLSAPAAKAGLKEQRKFRQDDNPGRHLSLPDYEHALGASTCSKCKLFLSAVHHQQLNRERLTEQALCRADLEREFHVAFQPIKDTHREQTVAFEALARWESPELGSVPPSSSRSQSVSAWSIASR